MAEEKNLLILLKTMEPRLQAGDYVFCLETPGTTLPAAAIVMQFKEQEGTTLIVEKSVADKYNLAYTFIAAWITLSVHSSLEAIGLTAAFSAGLAKEAIGCNVVAGFYHDHIFVPKNQAQRAMKTLKRLAE